MIIVSTDPAGHVMDIPEVEKLNHRITACRRLSLRLKKTLCSFCRCLVSRNSELRNR